MNRGADPRIKHDDPTGHPHRQMNPQPPPPAGPPDHDFFTRYSEAFRLATGMELDLLRCDGGRWRSLHGDTRNPLCREIMASRRGGTMCASGLCAAAAEPAVDDRFIPVDCIAGMRCAVRRLSRSGDSAVFLLAGRVATGNPGHPDPGAIRSNIVRLVPELEGTPLDQAVRSLARTSRDGFQAAIDLLGMSLPHLRGHVEDALAAPTSALSRLVQDAIRHIGAHYRENIRLADVARACSVSADHLSHRFASETGLRFNTYLTGLRVNTAAALLRGSSLPVTEICFSSGFQSISQFNRAFRAGRGMAPREFRRTATAADAH